MLFAIALMLLQQATPTIVWDQPSPTVQPAPVADSSATSSLPEWARADPFAYERARCSPMVRGDTPLEACQAQTRAELALALGDALPDALKPASMPDDCRMAREAGGGSPYAPQCGPRPRTGAPLPAPAEQECRARPARGGGFTSECRPTSRQEGEGLTLRLGGDDD